MLITLSFKKSLIVEQFQGNYLNKETQNPLSDSFGFKNPILDFLKETHPNFWENLG